MEPSKPLFEIGETVILAPFYNVEKTRHCRGIETRVLERRWMYGREAGIISYWCWGYITEKMPIEYHYQGKLYTGGHWAEHSLRKKHQPGMGFSHLLVALSSPMPIEEVVYE